jgi:hypothetical protein
MGFAITAQNDGGNSGQPTPHFMISSRKVCNRAQNLQFYLCANGRADAPGAAIRQVYSAMKIE